MWKIFVWSFALFNSSVNASSLESLTYTTEEYPPTTYLEDGKVKGLAVDILKLIWKNLAVAEQPIYVLPWARAFKNIEYQNDLVLFTMAKTKDRLDLFQWACSVESTRYVVYGFKNSTIEINNLTELESYNIGTIRFDASESILFNLLENRDKIVSNISMSSNLKMMAKKRIQMIVYNENNAKKMFLRYGFNPNDFKVIYPLKTVETCFAFSKNIDKALISQFQEELSKIIQLPIYQTLLKKYYH